MKNEFFSNTLTERCLTALAVQCLGISVATDPQGNWKFTRNNARQFMTKGKDDFHDGARNAYIGFRIWLLENVAGCGTTRGIWLCATTGKVRWPYWAGNDESVTS